MSAFKGTPAPWRSVPAPVRSEYTRFVLGPGEDEEIADVIGSANADLIESAPDVLLALQQTAYVFHTIAHPELSAYETCEFARCRVNREVIAAALGEQS